MAKKTKYYVVWEGHQPGIYTSWTDAQKQIHGYTGAKFMSFTNKSEAELAFRTGEMPKSLKSKNKEKYYVVWQGHRPGIYTHWDEALKQIAGFKNAKYKIFGSKKLAQKAFEEGPLNYQGDYKKTRDLSDEELKKIGIPIELSLCVDAACNHKGDFEYRGVWTFSRDEVFKVGPYKKGSNNIGEFLALVHALAFLNGHKDEQMKTMPIYSDSKIAMGWVKAKVCRTKQKPSAKVLNLIDRAEHWLNTNTYKNPILKWETKVWGEIPADFGRK
ncbi:MAG TPA: ribonuclease H [Crocinitomix sp.]|nr:ribonuclease H [Crocinitomix sp.]